MPEALPVTHRLPRPWEQEGAEPAFPRGDLSVCEGSEALSRSCVQRFLSATPGSRKASWKTQAVTRGCWYGERRRRTRAQAGLGRAGVQCVTQAAFQKREEEVTEQVVFNPLGRKGDRYLAFSTLKR